MGARILVWRATLLFVLTGYVEVMLHETAHAVAAIALGATRVVMVPGAVYPDGLPDSKMVIVAMAGPIFSVVMMLVGAVACRKLHERNELRLAAVWLTFHSFIGGIGYLILTPFAGNDLGGIAQYYELAPLVRWGMFGAGMFAMTRIDPYLLPALVEHAPSAELVATPRARGTYVLQTALLPWLVFGASRIAVDWPLPSIWSLGPTIGMVFPLIATFGAAHDKKAPTTADGSWGERAPWALTAATVAVYAFNLFVLRGGLTLKG